MALSYSVLARGHLGPNRAELIAITFDSSYPSNGESIAAADIGFTHVVAAFSESTSTGRLVQYDRTNKKFVVYNPVTAHTHVENTAASYTQNATTAAATAGVATDVPNATDLSALVAAVLVIGW